jgi:hypothetical protein
VKIAYLYDKPEWALHNVGRLLQPHFEQAGHTFELLEAGEYYRSPVKCDVLYLSFSFLFRGGFEYRKYTGEIVCTLHDPFEVSNFTNTFDWVRLPLKPISPRVFDRVSVISRQMFDVLRSRLQLDHLFLTPTFPHDRVAAQTPKTSGESPIFFSATNAPRYYSVKEVLGRARYLDVFLRDERKQLSPRQLTSALIRTHRKNIPWLDRIARTVTAAGGRTDFRHSYPSGTMPSREAYLRSLGAADVYVCTSYMEGGPLTVMEAVQAGLAVLTTPVGQVSDWVVDGYNGFISDDLKELRKRAEQYCRGEHLREHQAGSRALAAGKEFDPDPWLKFVLG